MIQETNPKQAAGHAAAQFVEAGMLVGLGTGSTASFFIDSLIERCRQGLTISAVATSEKSRQQALAGGIPLVDMAQVTTIDLTVDGADQIDPQKRMIKGGGGALVREKIIASASREMVVVVDSSKLVKQLGAFPLPVEVIPFGYRATLAKLNSLGYQGQMRRHPNQELYTTDNGNYIYDIHFDRLLDNPEEINAEILFTPGVVDTGFFFNLASRVIVAYPDGHLDTF
jgi:ribose 5-phosphate isomerase A